VRTHPVTGRRALFLSGRFMDQIVGMHRDESDALLGYLQRHTEDPNFSVRWPAGCGPDRPDRSYWATTVPAP